MEVQTNDAEAGSLATPAPEDELGDADAEPGGHAGAFNDVGQLPFVSAPLIPLHRHWDCAALLLGCCLSGQLPVKASAIYQAEHSLSACYPVTPPIVYAVPEVVAPKRRAAAKRRRAPLPKLRPEDSLGQTDLASQR